MLQTNDKVLQKLLLEKSRLVDMIKNLETFMCTADFTTLPVGQSQLLLEQHSVMKRYNEVLLKRVMLLRSVQSNEDRMKKIKADTDRCIAKYWRKEE